MFSGHIHELQLFCDCPQTMIIALQSLRLRMRISAAHQHVDLKTSCAKALSVLSARRCNAVTDAVTYAFCCKGVHQAPQAQQHGIACTDYTRQQPADSSQHSAEGLNKITVLKVAAIQSIQHIYALQLPCHSPVIALLCTCSQSGSTTPTNGDHACILTAVHTH